MDSLQIYFVLQSKYEDESQVSNVMLQAYESCKQNKVNSRWIREENLDSEQLERTDFVVFEEFKGNAFNTAKTTSRNVAIVGPWCVLICITEGKKIPNVTWPIFNVAMYDCVVTTSNLTSSSKAEIREMVHLMGGIYSDTLLSNNTHLVTASVNTEKYYQACEKGIKVMLPSWVKNVWESCQTENVRADSKQFEKYKCPPFHKLIFCSTGFKTSKERTEIANLITQNGGSIEGRLVIQKTDVLICHEESTNTDKYKAARKADLKCVTLDWLRDSVKKGYALPFVSYQLKKSTSTPTKLGVERIDPNFSMMSAIGVSKINISSLEETIAGNGTLCGFGNNSVLRSGGLKRKATDEHDYLVEQLDIKKAKKSGQFLDGCSVYLVGFVGEQREKLIKILNLSGATRYDDISDRVSHVIVGDASHPELKIIKQKHYPCIMVSIEWLIESMKMCQPANEDQYIVKIITEEESKSNKHLGSPLSQKGFNLLRSNQTMTEEDAKKNDESTIFKEPLDIDDIEKCELMQRYLQPEPAVEEDSLAKLLQNAGSTLNPDNTKATETKSKNNPSDLTSSSKGTLCVDTTDPHSAKKRNIPPPLNSYTQESEYTEAETETEVSVFAGINFRIIDCDDDLEGVKEFIVEAGGTIVEDGERDYDYAIVAAFMLQQISEKKPQINQNWIQECVRDHEIVRIKYYHRPLVIKETSPLEGCVITLSSYQGLERHFLRTLIQHLGGVHQEQFARVTSVEKNLLGSTHLVSAELNTKKFIAAGKWKIPVVGEKWLLECAKTGIRLPETDFPVIENRDESLASESVLPASVSKTVQEETLMHNNESTSRNDTPNNTNQRNSTIQPNFATPNQASTSKMGTPCNNTKNNDNFATPLTHKEYMHFGSVGKNTPQNDGTPNAISQVTPISKIMQEVRSNNILGTPDSPGIPKFDIDTPKTPYGLESSPSKSTRKQWARFLNNLPEYHPPRRRDSTPLSEIKRQFWQRMVGSQMPDESENTENQPDEDVFRQRLSFTNHDDSDNFGADKDVAVEHVEQSNQKQDEFTQDTTSVNNKLLQLEEMLAASSGSAKSRRTSRVFQSTVPPHVAAETYNSQPFTVNWDFDQDVNKKQPELKVFMLTGVEPTAKESLTQKIESLGGVVENSDNYCDVCTHLLCFKPSRNEKTLACMAAGNWILHINYIYKSEEAGHFLDEEEYEFGNSKAIGNFDVVLNKEMENRMQSIYYWRQEVKRRGYGAFHDIRAIIIAKNEGSIRRVVEAGGGSVLKADPPYAESLHVTHCLIEIRSVPENDFRHFVPLAERGVWCVNTVYISEYLHRICKDIKNSIVSNLRKHY